MRITIIRDGKIEHVDSEEYYADRLEDGVTVLSEEHRAGEEARQEFARFAAKSRHSNNDS